jgi:DNA invertase Pin-like site-specific DNA recombinase
MQAITDALRARVTPAAVLLGAAIAIGVLFAGSAAASTAYSAASANPPPIPWTGWHGRPIQRPQTAVSRTVLARASYPAPWKAGAVRYGTGYHRFNGSQRVREVQRRLTRLGYHTGPIDGLYGPLTRSSVQWFQIKHGLRPTGVVAAATLATLRQPKAATQHGKAQAKNPRVPANPQPQVTPTRQPTQTPAKSTHNSTPAWLLAAFIAALAAALVLGALLIALLARRRRAAEPEAEPGAVAAEALPLDLPEVHRSQPEPNGPALGYVSSRDARSSEPHEAAIKDACRQRGWKLTRIVRDVSARPGRVLGRPGLSYALEQLADGVVSRLVVNQLEQLGRSRAEQRLILGWFVGTGMALTVLDVDLDTTTPEGRSTLSSLFSVAMASRGRFAPTTENELAAARARGRPSVEDSPDLANRIREMRSGGMTLQAIADTLNEEGVPTVRGGAEWRPSSVQSVLGYKRSSAERWG